MVVLVAQLAGPQMNAVQAAYHKLTPAQIEAKKVTSDKPPKDAHRIDVSARMRSTSFGHKTWLLVAPDGAQFWVEYGRSTNRPGGTYGPFSVATAQTGPRAPTPPPPTK
jgi:hypothetical protein